MSEGTSWLRPHRSKARPPSYGNMSSTAFSTLIQWCPREFRLRLCSDAKVSRYLTMVAGWQQRTSPISFVCMEKISNVSLVEQAVESLALENRPPLELPTSFVSILSAKENKTLYL